MQGIVNCCSGEGHTLQTIVIKYLKERNNIIKLNLGFYPYADYEPMVFWGDDTKLKLIIKNE